MNRERVEAKNKQVLLSVICTLTVLVLIFSSVSALVENRDGEKESVAVEAD